MSSPSSQHNTTTLYTEAECYRNEDYCHSMGTRGSGTTLQPFVSVSLRWSKEKHTGVHYVAGPEDSVRTPATRSISDLKTARSLCHEEGTVAPYHGRYRSEHKSVNSINTNQWNTDSCPFAKFPEYFDTATFQCSETTLIISLLMVILYRVAQNKIPHQTICNISATSGLILKILEATYS